MARTNACEEVSLKSSYALVAAGVVLGSLAHGGALYWGLVLMVALFAAAVSVYRALVEENARLYFERREQSAPFIRILIRALVEGPDESRREAARDLATKAAESDDSNSVGSTAWAFFWQGPGMCAPYVVAIILRACLASDAQALQWRLLLGLGAAPALLAAVSSR